MAVRAGEHACGRFDHATDGDRLAAAFILDGIMLGHKAVYLCDRDVAAFESELVLKDHRFRSALARGQLEIRPSREAYLPNGRFEVERTLQVVRDEKARAHADGYPALRMTGEMTWALEAAPGTERLGEYEQRLAGLFEDQTLTGFCQYHEARFGAGVMADVASAHRVDVTPELASLGRSGYLSAALLWPGNTLRLTGALDSLDADSVASLLEEQFGEDMKLDLADLTFVDIAGMRALLGTNGRSVTITRASEPVRRLLDVLGWDDLASLEGSDEA